ncbi:energy transducer TonB [Massilia sp. PAMC28688]|uniref:energy transducer TonB n=1 Tax=Massilia sp. PAMC28688 TaxID=2861283 RepID=UPI001C624AFC|nr:energy transducer TonB [Massilia sp. PAMC28688]QYF94863.1 energy transducer TonB [Massilia sp. PAMC28688]
MLQLPHRFMLAPAVLLALAGCAAPALAADADRPAVADFNSCAKPMYPKDALANKREGTVTVAFLVGTDGKTEDAKVKTSSGHADLDEAARVAIAKCRFSPAIKGGEAVRSWQPVQYVWTLK